MSRRLFCFFLLVGIASAVCSAQSIAPPSPQRVVIHSNILSEDRVIWVRMPAASQASKASYPVLYMTDGGSNVNEIGSTMDFLAENNRMPPLIVVGITHADRVRDLTPTHVDVKDKDDTVNQFPTSGGANKFLDFIQTELVPEIEKRFPTKPYRIFAGHSLGGLFAIHALISRPDLFNAYIAVSPSLWWDNAGTLHQAQQFFSAQKELKKTLFFSLGNEDGEMMGPFGELQKTLGGNLPKGFAVKSAHYPDEDHNSTVLVAHYAGLRAIFDGWEVPRDPNGRVIGPLAVIEEHYQALSLRFGFSVSAEQGINALGYDLLTEKKTDEAIAAFRRNVELYPLSANVYDSLADGLEAKGETRLAIENLQKAVAIGTQNNDPGLLEFKRHLERLSAASKADSEKSHQPK
ncbi:MAG TPA: alpha/beta hydrolase-fold protein [Candidatus Angelobacter sp.]|nr:alpha/beta hydrolase-fold protein [Candidatus Angelobacter sp.]